MRPLPPEAPKDIRETILKALKSDEFSLYGNARRFLENLDFEPESVIRIDLVEYLEAGRRLYLLTGPTIKGIKYQCCLGYEGDLDIYFKLTPCERDQMIHVQIGCHRHDTGYHPLPE